MSAFVTLLYREERLRVPVLLEDRAVLGHLAVADVFPRVVAEQDDIEGVVARAERVDDRQVVGLEGRMDLLALHAAAHVGHGVGGDLFGCARVDLRRDALLGIELVVEGCREVLQRVDECGLAGRYGAQRVGRALGGLQTFRAGGFAGVACRGRGRRDRHEGSENQQVSFHAFGFISCRCLSAALRRLRGPCRTPRRSGG